MTTTHFLDAIDTASSRQYLADPLCRHCKEVRSFHQEDKCLFDASPFNPMTLEEYQAHVKALMGDAGSSFIKDMLKQESFTRSLFKAIPLEPKKK